MNISVIIPVHEYNDDLSSYLDKAVESIVKQEDIEKLPQIIIVFPTAIQKSIEGFVEASIRKYQEKGITYESFYLINNTEKTDYQSQVNLAVKSVTTDYFSVLEFDDEYSTTFFKNAIKYTETYPEIDTFLTMMIEVNDKNEGIKLTNEIVWSQQFVGENGEMGYLNAKAIKQFTDFKLSGAVIKKSDFVNLGGYKSNIKLSFMYEYILRALNNASKIYSIPKIGYKHLAIRENCLSDEYIKTMSLSERRFWFEVAVREANFTNDRVIDMSLLKK